MKKTLKTYFTAFFRSIRQSSTEKQTHDKYLANIDQLWQPTRQEQLAHNFARVSLATVNLLWVTNSASTAHLFERNSSLKTSQNPYAAPSHPSPALPEPPIDDQVKAPPTLRHSVTKWTVACGFAAAPSFFIAATMVHPKGALAASGGMLVGIAIFIALYVFFERLPRVQQILSYRFVRNVAWFGYGARIVATVIFPVGLTIDIFCGLLSVSITEFFWAAPNYMMQRTPIIENADHAFVFSQYLITTLLQGTILNFVLLGFMVFIYGIFRLCALSPAGEK